jgi:CHAT domain-containing protein
LHYLPFEALYDGERYLVEDYVIGYVPSASLLRYLNGATNERISESALVLGNPDNPAVSSLEGAEAEARAVAELFGVPAYLNAEATESRLWEQAANARYVHVAAHGTFNATAPQFSRLYLAPSAAGDAADEDALSSRTDGLLETREVWNLALENADLVTLSACQTQLGDLSAGDELVGLSRAFIYAGTPALVASLWSVEDASTEYLMTRFYGYLQAGQPPGTALRQAKLDTMEEYPSPYHWAAFTLIGDMGEVETGGIVPSGIVAWMTSNRFWVGGAVVLIVLVGLGLWVRKRRK